MIKVDKIKKLQPHPDLDSLGKPDFSRSQKLSRASTDKYLDGRLGIPGVGDRLYEASSLNTLYVPVRVTRSHHDFQISIPTLPKSTSQKAYPHLKKHTCRHMCKHTQDASAPFSTALYTVESIAVPLGKVIIFLLCKVFIISSKQEDCNVYISLTPSKLT